MLLTLKHDYIFSFKFALLGSRWKEWYLGGLSGNRTELYEALPLNDNFGFKEPPILGASSFAGMGGDRSIIIHHHTQFIDAKPGPAGNDDGLMEAKGKWDELVGRPAGD